MADYQAEQEVPTEEQQRALYEAFHWGKCPTPRCRGDERYAAPGRGHIEGCTYPSTPPDQDGGS